MNREILLIPCFVSAMASSFDPRPPGGVDYNRIPNQMRCHRRNSEPYSDALCLSVIESLVLQRFLGVNWPEAQNRRSLRVSPSHYGPVRTFLGPTDTRASRWRFEEGKVGYPGRSVPRRDHEHAFGDSTEGCRRSAIGSRELVTSVIQSR